MKKLIAAALILVAAFVLAACGQLKQPPASSREDTPQSSRADEIGMTSEKPEEKPEEKKNEPAATLASNQYVVWTFSFKPETVENDSADLSVLKYDCKTNYYY